MDRKQIREYVSKMDEETEIIFLEELIKNESKGMKKRTWSLINKLFNWWFNAFMS